MVKLADAAQYFQKAMLRIYSVLEAHLSGQYRASSATPREYLAGDGVGKYSIADMGTWPHVRGYRSLGFSEDDMQPKFPHLLRWIERIEARPLILENMIARRILNFWYELRNRMNPRMPRGWFRGRQMFSEMDCL
jgi:glutathione S-transferase